jgi:hypothetical protein
LIVSNYVDKKTQPFFKYPLAPNNWGLSDF